MENGDNEDSESRKFIWVEGGGREEREDRCVEDRLRSLGEESPKFAGGAATASTSKPSSRCLVLTLTAGPPCEAFE